MALETDTLASTGATLAVGSNIVFDGVTVGASTGKIEVVKLADGTAGSTTMVPMSSAGIGTAGLNVFVTNSTANPLGVSIAAGQSTVTGSGVFHVDDNAGSLTIDFNNAAISSANPIPMQLVSTSATPGPVMISSAAPGSTDLGLAVRQVGFVAYSTNVTIAALSSASIVKIDTIAAFPANSSLVVINAAVPQSSVTLSTSGAGGSTANPLFVVDKLYALSGPSTWAAIRLTSTAVTTLLSSAASTRFNIVDLDMFNSGASEVTAVVYDGSTSGTVLYRAELSSAGGGFIKSFAAPRRGSSGNPIVVEVIPASTVFINIGAFKTA